MIEKYKCTICDEEITKQMGKISEKWETDKNPCSCEMLKYIVKLEKENKILKSKLK